MMSLPLHTVFICLSSTKCQFAPLFLIFSLHLSWAARVNIVKESQFHACLQTNYGNGFFDRRLLS